MQLRHASLALPLLTLTPLAPAQSQGQATAGFRAGVEDEVLTDLDGDLSTTDDQVRITAQTGLDLTGSVCSNVAGGGCGYLLEALAGATGSATFRLEAGVGATVDELFVQDPGLIVPLTTIPTGFGDITLSMRFLSTVRVQGDISAASSVELALEAPFEGGFRIDPGLGFVADFAPQANFIGSAPVLDGASGASFDLGAFAAVEFLTTVNGLPIPSPSFLFGPNAHVEVDPLGTPWWSIDVTADILNFYGNLGVTGSLVPITVLDSRSISQLDSGGALGDPDAVVGDRWAKTYDWGSLERTDFALEGASDPAHSLIFSGPSETALEIDAAGNVVEAWTWLGPVPEAGFPKAGEYTLIGTSVNDSWIGRYAGGGSFPLSKKLQVIDVDSVLNSDLLDLVELPDGDVIAGGLVSVAGNVNRRFLTRLDPTDGTPRWARLYGFGNLSDAFGGMVLASDGNVVIAGRQESDPSGLRGLVLTKVTPDGDVVWSRLLEDNADSVRVARDLLERPSGGFTVAGDRSINPFVQDPPYSSMLVLFDPNGVPILERYLAVELGGDEILGDSTVDSIERLVPIDNGFLMCGIGADGFEADGWLWSGTQGGSVVHCASFRTESTDRFMDVRPTADGGLLGFGDSQGLAPDSGYDLMIVRSGVTGYVPLDPASAGESSGHVASTVQYDLDEVIGLTVEPLDVTLAVSDVPPSLINPVAVTVTDIAQ